VLGAKAAVEEPDFGEKIREKVGRVHHEQF
jgi:hypothetical protein